LVILGFLSDCFGEAEFEKADELRLFCTNKYEMTLTIMKKAVLTPNGKHDVYKWLTDNSKNGKLNSEVDWDFKKYLIGELEKVVSPGTKPYSKEMIEWIESWA